MEATVLRRQLVRDIHAGNDLDALGDCTPVLFMQRLCRIKNTILPVTQTDKVFLRLKVKVRNADLNSIEHQRIDQTDDRVRISLLLAQRRKVRSRRFFIFKFFQYRID